MEPAEKSFVEKRQGVDFWVKFVKTAAIFVWAAMFIILVIIDRAKPQVENFFSNLFQISLRQSWDSDLLAYAFSLSVAMLGFSVFAFIINMKRHRRKSDKYSKSILAMIFFTLAVILFCWSKF
ncbi:MAG: hypothetical protein ACOY35_00180 [Bacillota bacterium]|nr:hypothetical protein [Bacillota bacterium]